MKLLILSLSGTPDTRSDNSLFLPGALKNIDSERVQPRPPTAKRAVGVGWNDMLASLELTTQMHLQAIKVLFTARLSDVANCC
jgi:hypothetical protein